MLLARTYCFSSYAPGRIASICSLVGGPGVFFGRRIAGGGCGAFNVVPCNAGGGVNHCGPSLGSRHGGGATLAMRWISCGGSPSVAGRRTRSPVRWSPKEGGSPKAACVVARRWKGRRRPLALRGAWRGRRPLALRGRGRGRRRRGRRQCRLEPPGQVPPAAQAYQALNPPHPQDQAEALPEDPAKPLPPPPTAALHTALPRQKESPLAGLHPGLCHKVPTELEQIHPVSLPKLRLRSQLGFA